MKRAGVPIAQNLRKKMTDAETKLWLHLRNRQLAGTKFRRQFPYGRYVLDFVCLEMRIAIEVDGGQHGESETDALRTQNLERDGFRVIRFWNNDVLRNIEGVLEAIRLALSVPPPSSLPSPQGEKEPPSTSAGVPSPQRGEGQGEGVTRDEEPSN